MHEYLYRYISFENFIGMIQSQSLTFVLPELWDDPKEADAFHCLLESCDQVYEQLMLCSVYYKTYCQCWSRLAESDAMWRIYAYNNRAIRIRAKQSNIDLLDNVKAVPVEYSDELSSPLPKKTFLDI